MLKFGGGAWGGQAYTAVAYARAPARREVSFMMMGRLRDLEGEIDIGEWGYEGEDMGWRRSEARGKRCSFLYGFHQP